MISILKITDHLKGSLEGDDSLQIERINNIAEAKEGEISFIVQSKYIKFLKYTRASAVLIARDLDVESGSIPALIRVDDVQKSLNSMLQLFAPNDIFEQGSEELIHLSDGVDIHDSVTIGNFTHIAKGVEIAKDTMIATQVYLGENVRIGQNVRIYPGVKIYRNSQIGDNCIIHSNAVIGSDGFGYSPNAKGYDKIPQIGNVIIEDGVEIGSNTVIDRATFSSTRIGKGVKLDNLIQVAHNVSIGDNTVIAAQSGLAGSVTMGENCVVGGQSAFVPHIDVAAGSLFQGKSGVGKSIKEPGGKYFGSPAIPFNDYIRAYSIFKKLPQIESRIRKLENELNQQKKQ